MEIENLISDEEPAVLVSAEFQNADTPRGLLHSRIVDLGKKEAGAGEAILAHMKPRWLAYVLATMCVIEEHGKSSTFARDDLIEA